MADPIAPSNEPTPEQAAKIATMLESLQRQVSELQASPPARPPSPRVEEARNRYERAVARSKEAAQTLTSAAAVVESTRAGIAKLEGLETIGPREHLDCENLRRKLLRDEQLARAAQVEHAKAADASRTAEQGLHAAKLEDSGQLVSELVHAIGLDVTNVATSIRQKLATILAHRRTGAGPVTIFDNIEATLSDGDLIGAVGRAISSRHRGLEMQVHVNDILRATNAFASATASGLGRAGAPLALDTPQEAPQPESADDARRRIAQLKTLAA
jgi:hypothetical protein